MSIVEQIDSDLKAINKHWSNPEMLSALLLRLSLSYGELGDLVSASEFEMENLKEQYDYETTKTITELTKADKSVASSQLEAKLIHRDKYKTYLEAKYSHTIVRLKRQAVEKIIDASRSRLSLIKGDIKNG